MFGYSWTYPFEQLNKLELEPKEGWQQRRGNTYYIERSNDLWQVYCWDNYDPRPTLAKSLDVVKVGVAVCIINNENKILMGHRHPDLTWGFSGGYLEFGEDLIDCAKREVLEETNIDLKSIDLEFSTAANHGHYVTLIYLAKIGDEEQKSLKNMEPNKCLGWKWCDWNKLPLPLMPQIQNLIDNGWRINL